MLVPVDARNAEERAVRAEVDAFMNKIKSAIGVVIRTSPEATYANIRAYSASDATSLLLAFIGQVGLGAQANGDAVIEGLCKNLVKEVEAVTKLTSTPKSGYGLQ